MTDMAKQTMGELFDTGVAASELKCWVSDREVTVLLRKQTACACFWFFWRNRLPALKTAGNDRAPLYL